MNTSKRQRRSKIRTISIAILFYTDGLHARRITTIPAFAPIAAKAGVPSGSSYLGYVLYPTERLLERLA